MRQKGIYRLAIIVTFLFPLLLGGCSKKEQSRGPHTIKEFRQGYSKTFNDLNPAHLSAAKAIGKTPFKSRADAEARHTLQEIASCQHYKVDPLTHSLPFLCKQGVALLEDIGRNFRDSLKSKSATDHQIIVTSVLRTQEDIKGLQRKNGNSSSNSAHLYGTTFDIAYGRFERLSENGEEIAAAHLKSVLAEVLRDLQKAKRCYIKYEVKQGCFHITARP